MGSWVDNLINYGVPLGVILWIAFLFYVKFKETFDTMFRTISGWIKGLFGAISGKTQDIAESSYEVVYTYGK